LEDHLFDRCKEIGEFHGIPVYRYPKIVSTYFEANVLKKIFRIRFYNAFIKENRILINVILNQKSERVYFSNSEGFTAINVINPLKRKLKKVRFITMQHGLFPLCNASVKKKCFLYEKLSDLIGFWLVGQPFGPRMTDEYIVFNNSYKSYLVKEYDWNPDSVSVNFFFLKPSLIEIRKNRVNKEWGKTAAFFTQCLGLSNICSEETEKDLIIMVLNYLSSKYDKVILKFHPACAIELGIDLPENVRVEENLNFILSQIDFAYSFFSTVLLEAEALGVKAFSIYSSRLNVEESTYHVFKKKLDLDHNFTNLSA